MPAPVSQNVWRGVQKFNELIDGRQEYHAVVA